ncbi:MAG: DUF2891 family protein [Ferruginibacter sp.]
MKLWLSFLLTFSILHLSAQKELTKDTPDGRMTLSDAGASYFANLSLTCASQVYPHYYNEHQIKAATDLKTPEKLWPSFYGCFDWHSGVHNHWALVKLLKNYPNIPEAKLIREKLEQSFNAQNILQEVDYLKTHADEAFEFPYGTSWLLKVADELVNWNDPKGKEWLQHLAPLTNYICSNYMLIWPQIAEATYTGNHYASSLGLSFALDYARSVKNDSLEAVVIKAAKKFYNPVTNFPLAKEPFNYDFMSAGLLITDLMRKIYTTAEYEKWLKAFSPDLFTIAGVKKVLAIEKLTDHTGFASHFDGFHLNRIWCINGMLKSLSPQALAPEVKKAWITAQRDMWDYAQESIGKGNYDVDHWLSSFSVFALIGYEK